MMGRSHLIAGACALEHAYVIHMCIERADIPFLESAGRVVQSYLGIEELVSSQLIQANSLPVSLSISMLSILLYLMMYFIGTLLPDIDNPNSMLGRFVHVQVKHRTWLHAIYLYLIPAILGIWYPACAWLFFGVFVHLFWDSFSAAGNCWFYKLLSDYKEYPGGAKIKKGHKLKLYHAGEWSEYLLLFGIVAVTMVSFIFINK